MEPEGGGGWRRTGTHPKEEQQEEEEQGVETVETTEQEQQPQQVLEKEEGQSQSLLQGIASIALFPSGSLSGHFLHTASSTCFGLFGTEIACERECSRGEDYRLINLTIINFKTKKETTVVVERRGEDAARLSTTCDLHGWDEEVVAKANERHGSAEAAPVISFECETLKADSEAEEHVRKFLPSLVGRDAVVNIGRMTMKGLSLSEKDKRGDDESRGQPQVPHVANSKRSLKDALRLVLGDLGHDHDSHGISLSAPSISSDSARKRQAISAAEDSEDARQQGFIIRSTPTGRAPCDLRDDF